MFRRSRRDRQVVRTARTSSRHPHLTPVEPLEDRRLLSVTFTETNLVSDVPGRAARTDPNLVNPWGITVGLNGGLWVSEADAGKAESFDGATQGVFERPFGLHEKTACLQQTADIGC